MENITGKDISFFCKCGEHPNDTWKLFYLWRSLTKFLPDSNIYVFWNSENIPKPKWAYKCKLKFVKSNFNNYSNLDISSVAVREISNINFIGPTSVKDEEFSCLINYSKGVGSWMENENFDFPCDKAMMKYGRKSLSINEYKVLNIFQRYALLYRSLI